MQLVIIFFISCPAFTCLTLLLERLNAFSSLPNKAYVGAIAVAVYFLWAGFCFLILPIEFLSAKLLYLCITFMFYSSSITVLFL